MKTLAEARYERTNCSRAMGSPGCRAARARSNHARRADRAHSTSRLALKELSLSAGLRVSYCFTEIEADGAPCVSSSRCSTDITSLVLPSSKSPVRLG
jgi:hypothetical protein